MVTLMIQYGVTKSSFCVSCTK